MESEEKGVKGRAHKTVINRARREFKGSPQGSPISPLCSNRSNLCMRRFAIVWNMTASCSDVHLRDKYEWKPLKQKTQSFSWTKIASLFDSTVAV